MYLKLVYSWVLLPIFPFIYSKWWDYKHGLQSQAEFPLWHRSFCVALGSPELTMERAGVRSVFREPRGLPWSWTFSRLWVTWQGTGNQIWVLCKNKSSTCSQQLSQAPAPNNYDGPSQHFDQDEAGYSLTLLDFCLCSTGYQLYVVRRRHSLFSKTLSISNRLRENIWNTRTLKTELRLKSEKGF